jgi:hypothetical protein
MKQLRRSIIFCLFASLLIDSEIASAQIPPHVPGAICFTPQFWCWVNPPGYPGSPCSCPTPYGWIGGRLG